MRQKSGTRAAGSEQMIRTIKRKTRRQYSAEEKIRIVLDGLRGEDSIFVMDALTENDQVYERSSLNNLFAQNWNPKNALDPHGLISYLLIGSLE